MTGSIARRVAVAGVAMLALALLAVGASTGAVLHLQALADLDRELLAAAHAHARSGDAARDDEDDVHRIETWVASPDDDRVPPRILARAARNDGPLVKDMGERRLLLLAAPVASEHDETRVVAALARRVTWVRSVGVFAAVWAVASAIVLGLAAAAMSGAVRLAFRPLDRARQDVARVVGLGQGQRVTTDAPDEVRPLLAAVNALLDRLDGAHAAQVRFTAEAAHELRTPVTAALGQLDVALRRDRPAEEWREVVVSVRDDVGRLQHLVEALTALARVDAGDVEVHRELVRAREIATGALAAEAAGLERARCRTTLQVDDDPELEVHRLLLELALGNLLRNAAKHAPGAAVTLTVRADGGEAAFEVRDSGAGLPVHLGDGMFDRFARGPAARAADPGGLGLGLPLAREVARRHGGDCTLQALPGGGARALLSVRRPG